MLKFPQKKFSWSGKAQSGFYFDFFLKKCTDIFIRNFFIYAALFFGEKYLIENITKKIIDNFLFYSNKVIGVTTLHYIFFFYTLLAIIFYFFLFLNLLVLFF